MRVSFTWRLGTFAGAVLSTIAFSCATSAVASAWWHSPKPPAPPTLYVNGSIAFRLRAQRLLDARYTTISAAVSAATPGSHIVVCPGTYDEGVQIDKPLVLSGIDAVIDASSSPFGNGVQIVGPRRLGLDGRGLQDRTGEVRGDPLGHRSGRAERHRRHSGDGRSAGQRRDDRQQHLDRQRHRLRDRRRTVLLHAGSARATAARRSIWSR